ncbi:hypothetical protein [Bacillus sp. FJAT-27245]|uniref:hypothetical protein n=1 Tax=Bacillus sp. FJAT-27245 TaxID=1684144 RepID=UPI0006A7BE6D|nr:hypothetical protein [Bacillus sp. FJAT-27245]
MHPYFVISHTSSTDGWEKLFTSILNASDSFTIYYPDGEFDSENPLMGGKVDFEGLKNIVIEPWGGMENSISINGKLNDFSRSIFLKLQEPSFEGSKPMLWYFKLYKNNTLLLTIEDFTVCLLENNQEVNSILKIINLDINNMVDFHFG